MGVEPASHALIDAMRQHGRIITVAELGSEELRYLDSMGAEANVGGENLTHILVRRHPSKVALLEEFLHGTQWKRQLIQQKGIGWAEVAVKDFMLRHRKLLGICEADVSILQALRDDAQRAIGAGGMP